MRIYVLTGKGKRICSSQSIPDTEGYRILSVLYSQRQATPETIADFTGFSVGAVKVALSTMRRRGIVAEITERGY